MNRLNHTPGTTIRCMDCGRRSVANEGNCGCCGAALRSARESFGATPSDNGAEGRFVNPHMAHISHATGVRPLSLSGPLVCLPDELRVTDVQSEGTRAYKAELDGRVIAAEPVIHERPDFDWCKLVTRLLWFLLVVIAPFILLRSVLVQLGALPAIFAIVGVLLLLRFLSPSNILSLLHLNMLLNPLRRSEDEQVPVRYFRIRDASEREYIIRAKGQIHGGNIASDDLISAWGRWRGGTLHLSRAYNQRTRSHVIVRSSQSWMGLVVTLGVVLLVAIYFYRPVHTIWQIIQSLGAAR